MISDTLANYISRDFSCILGLSTLEMSGSLFLVSPLNKRYTYPSLTNASIDFRYNPEKPLIQMNEWSKESGIYTLSSDDILNKEYISSNNDWKISTILNLAPTLDEAIHGSLNSSNENYSFISTISFDGSKIQSLENIRISYTEQTGVDENNQPIYTTKNEVVSLTKNEFLSGYINPTTPRAKAIKNKINEITENSKIQLFKQGFDNLDGVLDCYFRIYKSKTEYFGFLGFKVYYFNGSGASTINLHNVSFSLDNSMIKNFISNFSLLGLILDSKKGFIKLYINDDFIENKTLDLIKINNSSLNYPSSNSDECKKMILGGEGSKCLKMRDFFVFDRPFLDYELKFFFMVIQGKFINKQIPDLVKLGILPKQVSEYTVSDIGSIISIPYTDSSGNIIEPIEFEVVGVNHHKDINDETKPTITLMTKNVIRYAAFDAIEQGNPDSNRASHGNNRWLVSNIRQWLNSEGAANEWFTSQHDYDQAPSGNFVYNGFGAYLDEAGFLAGFSNEVKRHLATIRNKTILCNADKSTLSKDYEETEDRAFLPSYTEMGFGNLDSNNPEGSHLAQKFIDNASRKKGNDSRYWMRTPYLNGTQYVFSVDFEGKSATDARAYNGDLTVAPLIVLC